LFEQLFIMVAKSALVADLAVALAVGALAAAPYGLTLAAHGAAWECQMLWDDQTNFASVAAPGVRLLTAHERFVARQPPPLPDADATPTTWMQVASAIAAARRRLGAAAALLRAAAGVDAAGLGVWEVRSFWWF